jgi:ATP-binding cassette, subfamily G (WHITE), member 2, SNQ2
MALVSAYAISKSSVEAISQVPQILLYCIIVVYLFELQSSPSKVLMFIVFQFLLSIAALSLINAISTVCVSIELTTAVTSFSFEIYRLYAGFFIPPIDQELYPKFKFFSITNAAKYGWVGSALNEYSGLEFTGCPTPPGACITNGEIINQRYGYDQFTLSQCIGYTVAIIAIWKAISYLGLRFIKF